MREPQLIPIRMQVSFALLGVAFLGIFSWVFFKEYLAEWRTYQARFRELQQEVKDPHALSLMPPADGIRQIWLADIDRVDRCTTCHLGADDPDFTDAPQPFRSHTGNWLQTHRLDQFGCTTCHDGQGEATTFSDAGHRPIPHWPRPMRSPELMEANCGTCHRERRPGQAFWLERGRQHLAESNCVACHDIPGFQLDEAPAPRLESVGYKVRPDWLRNWLADPESYLPQSRMPNFRLQPEEIDSIGAFLLSQRDIPPLDSSGVDWDAADPDEGRTVFREARCISCHMIDGRGGELGPDLSMVGSKVRREWLYGFIKDPMQDQPDTLMVRYRFSEEEIRDLVAYLMEDLVDPEVPAVPPETRYLDPQQIDAGREVFVRHGCYSCHRFSGWTDLGKIGPALSGIGDRVVEESDFEGSGVNPTLPNWLYLKLQTPEKLSDESRMPTYNFSNVEAASATVALLSIHAADLPASRVTDEPLVEPYDPQGEFGKLVRRYRCLSCHEVEGWGGTLSTVPLDRIGSQLQRDYLESYLIRPFAVRVSVVERMPHFNMTAEEARTFADYFSAVFVDDGLESPVEMRAESERQGRQLFEKLGCRACHIVEGQGGYVGPDLSDSGRRLKPGWTMAWLLQPDQWKPGTLQPDYGLEPEEARALTAYLMSLSTQNAGGMQ